jgi:hypothetical protein
LLLARNNEYNSGIDLPILALRVDIKAVPTLSVEEEWGGAGGDCPG